MTQNFGNAFLKKPPHKHEPAAPEPVVRPALVGKVSAAPKPTYAKIFRWQLPEDRTQAPATVEIVGTFTNWQKVPLTRKNKADGWQVIIPDVPAHKTHHYMLLVDGQPTHDKNSDGLAVPHGPLEKHYQLMTARGPRLFMLFAQTK
jgi:Glycogen recognition site of AMP-activated protein kinase